MSELLTDDELRDIRIKMGDDYGDYKLTCKTVAQAQLEKCSHSQPLIEQKERKKIGEYLQRTLMVKGEIVRVPNIGDFKVIHPIDLSEIIKALKSGEPLEGGKG